MSSRGLVPTSYLPCIRGCRTTWFCPYSHAPAPGFICIFKFISAGSRRYCEKERNKERQKTKRDCERNTEGKIISALKSLVFFFFFIPVCRKLQMRQRDLPLNGNSSEAHRFAVNFTGYDGSCMWNTRRLHSFMCAFLTENAPSCFILTERDDLHYFTACYKTNMLTCCDLVKASTLIYEFNPFFEHL